MTWIVLGASVTGTAHRAKNRPCQDAFFWRTFGTEDEWLALAVADGAGSATHSDVAAQWVCRELVQRVEICPFDQLATDTGILMLFTEVRHALYAHAEYLRVNPRELASTALLAIVGPEEAIFAQIGDGAIVIGHGEDYQVVFWPEPGEYVNTTDFLTDEALATLIRFRRVQATIRELAVLTDGLQRLALDLASRTAYAGFFRPIFRRLQTMADSESLTDSFRAFLDSDRVNQRTDDDKTLVVALRQP
jgi:hypothetical protein